MNFIDDMKIGQKLIGGFLIVVLILVIVAAVGYMNMGVLDATNTIMYQNRTVPLGQLGKVDAELQQLQDEFYLYALVPESRASLEPQILKVRANIKKEMDAYDSSSLTAEEHTYLVQFDTNYTAFNTAYDDGMAAIKATDQKNVTAALTAGSPLLTSRTAAVTAIQGLHKINVKKVYQSSSMMLLIATIIGVVIALSLSLFLIKSITVPFNLATRNLKEMSNGHLGNRLKLNRKDEIGEMAAVMDQFSDDLQNQVIGTIKKIADGDISTEVKPKDAQDEIGPALQIITASLRALVADANMLAKATVEGNFDTRADASKHKGDYKKIVEDFNGTLDAVIGPLNVAANYVDRISKGDIPPKITDKYNGDFNVMKNNLNNFIDKYNAVTADEGKLATRADATKDMDDYQIEPKWEIHEPQETNDPVPHSLKILSKYDNYLGVGASLRGKYHAHNALYREDSFKFGHSNGWIIIAVADGAGSAKLSRVGSSLACETIVNFLQLRLEKCDISASDDGLRPSEAFLTDIRSMLVEAVTASQQRLDNESTIRKIEKKEFATTLLVGIHKKWKEWHFIVGLQIGDGSIVFWDGKDIVRKLGNSDSGQYASETVFITSKGSEQNLANRVFFFLWKDIKSIALMTDGVADDFFPEDKMMPEMFRAIQEKFNATKQEDYDLSLVEWLGYERRGSFDDRTIAIIYNKS